MEKQLQKLLALLAVLSVLFGSAWMLTGAAAPAADGTETLLQEDFSAAKDPEGWSFAGSSHSYQDGWLVTRTGMPYYAGDARWSDYTFTAKMKIVPVETPTATGKQYYGVRFAIDAATNKGVEFCLIYNPADGGCMWRAYDRVTGSSIVSNGALTGVTVAAEQELTLQVKLAGTKATFFVNGVQQGQGTATRTLTGGVGTYTFGNTYAVAWFDDITVTRQGSVKPQPDPEEPTSDEKTLFLDGFNEADGEFKPDGSVWSKAGSMEYLSGQLHMRSAGNAYYTAAAAAAYTNYAVTVQMTVTDKNTAGIAWTASDNKAYSGLAVWAQKSGSAYSGYEFTVIYDGTKFTARLYDRLHQVMLCPETAVSGLAVNRAAELTVRCFDRTIACLVNGTEVFRYTLAEGITPGGTVGLLSGTARTRFNYVHLTQEAGDPPAPTYEGDTVTVIDGDFSTATDGDKPINRENGWRQGIDSLTVQDGQLVLDHAVNLYADHTFKDGYITAELTVRQAAAALESAPDGKTVYPVALSARNTGDTHEIRARLALTKQSDGYTAQLQVIVYSAGDYGNIPQVTSYPLADFALEKAYTVELRCVGNYFAVLLDGATLYEGACSSQHGLYDRVGSFGLFTLNDTAVVGVRRIRIVKYDAKSLSVDSPCAATVHRQAYNDLTSGSGLTFERDAYYAGEFVVVTLTPENGYALAPDSLCYKTAAGRSAITAKESETVYGFFMPAENAVLYAEFIPGGSSADTVWFFDDFDSENAMTDRGWSVDGSIRYGALTLNPAQPYVYLTGVAGSAQWSDYVAQATCRVLDADASYASSVHVASLVVRTTGAANGYEFGIQIPANAQKGNFRLMDRKTGRMLASSKTAALRNQNYVLKVLVEDNRIRCYVDGALCMDVIDTQSSNLTGSVGLRSFGTGEYDNVTVRAIAQADRVDAGGDSNNSNTAPQPPMGDKTLQRLPIWIAGAVLSGSISICGCLRRKRQAR